MITGINILIDEFSSLVGGGGLTLVLFVTERRSAVVMTSLFVKCLQLSNGP